MGVGVIVAGKLGGHYSAEGVKGFAPSLFPPCSMPESRAAAAQALLAGRKVAFFQNAVTALVLLPGLLWVARRRRRPRWAGS
jgi:S-adenosylmethionine uptake transporter